jgi:hypothetical protein
MYTDTVKAFVEFKAHTNQLNMESAYTERSFPGRREIVKLSHCLKFQTLVFSEILSIVARNTSSHLEPPFTDLWYELNCDVKQETRNKTKQTEHEYIRAWIGSHKN